MSFQQSFWKFFGVSTKTENNVIQEWQRKIERKIKRGEFGISLKRSIGTVHRANSAKLLSSARKVLSMVEASQMEDDKNDGEMTLDDLPASKPCFEMTVDKVYYTGDEIEFPAENVSASDTAILSELSELAEASAHYKEKDSHGLIRLGHFAESGTELYDQPDVEVAAITLDSDSEEKDKEKKRGKCEVNCENQTDFGTEEHISKNPKGTASIPLAQRQLKETINVTFEMNDIDSNDLRPKNGAHKTDILESQNAPTDLKGNTRCEEMVSESIPQEIESIQTETDIDALATVSCNKKDNPISLGPEDVVYGKDAYIHYTFYTKIEKKKKEKDLERELEEKMFEYDWKIQAVQELVTLAKDYYWNPKSKNAEKWRSLKKRVKKSSSHNLTGSTYRRQLDSIPEYRPYFTIVMSILQVIAFCVACILGGFTYIGVEPQLSLQEDVQTILGMETVHKWTPPNIWLGPDQQHLISFGSVFAACMRKDIQIQLLYARQNLSTQLHLGCCEIRTRNVAATTTEAECHTLTEGVGVWNGNSSCSERSQDATSVRHVLKPCCVGTRGQCRLLSHKHCSFLQGHFHRTGPEHCSQVNCLGIYCTPGHLSPSPDQPWMPASPYQWWRVPLSLLYHHGVIHLLMVVVVHLLLLVQIERTVGWLRMLIIYALSGTGSLLISAIIDPYRCHVGAVGAVFGMVGVTFIELVQFWAIVQKPVRELAKLVIALLVFLFCGTLPYFNIFGMLGGLVIGALTGIILLPYITFNQWKTKIRILLVLLSVPVLLVFFLLLIYIFHAVQNTENCAVCQLLNCVPYTDKMCNQSLWQQEQTLDTVWTDLH